MNLANQNPLGINGENPQNSSGLGLPFKICVSEKEDNPVKVKITKKSESLGYMKDKNWFENFGEFDIRWLKLSLQVFIESSCILVFQLFCCFPVVQLENL